MAYTPPAEYPFKDSPSTATPVYAATLDAFVKSLDDLDGKGGRVASVEGRVDAIEAVSQVNVVTEGAAGDARKLLDAAVTAAGTTLTSAAGGFTADDTGKTIVVWGAGAAGATLTTTVTYLSATTLTLAAAAGTTVSAATAFLGTDDSAAFTAAGAALPAEGGTIRIPAGAYLIGTALTSTKKIRWEGEGGGGRPSTATGTKQYNATTVWWIGSATGTALTLGGDGSQLVNWCLENAAEATPTAGLGVSVTAGYYNRYTDFTVSNFYDLVNIETGSEWIARGCTFFEPVRYGLRMRNDTHTDEGDMRILGNSFVCREREPTAAVHWTTGGGLLFSNNKINNDFRSTGAKDKQWRYGIHAALTAETSVFLVENNSIENYGDTGIYFEGGLADFSGIKLTGNEFLATKATYQPRAIRVTGSGGGDVRNIVIDDNTASSIGGSSNFAYQVADCDTVSVGAGNIVIGYTAVIDVTTCINVIERQAIGPHQPNITNTGRWVKPAGQAVTAHTIPTADRCHYIPITISNYFYLLSLACYVTLGQASATVHMAFYADSGIGQPAGTPLGTTASAAATADDTLVNLSVTLAGGVAVLPPGLYWVAVVAHAPGTVPTLVHGRNTECAFSTAFPAELVYTDRTHYSEDGVTGVPGTVGSLNARTEGPTVAVGLS